MEKGIGIKVKKALIIGAGGFVGGYLMDHLLYEKKWSVYATKMAHESISNNSVSVHDLNILDKASILCLLKQIEPDYIFHLAAQSSVALSWKNPELTVDVNIKGCICVLEAVRSLEKPPRLLLIGSGEEYGPVSPENVPVSEAVPPAPSNIYSTTKLCQTIMGKLYADAYNLDIIMVRAFNHIGPKQSPIFVVSDFCKQIAEIKRGLQEPIIKVGNLEAKRDFTDVRDVVNAYSLLIEHGVKGETYNVGSGKAVSIKEILNRLIAISKMDITVVTDPTKLRPIDVPIIEADVSKIMRQIHWQKHFTLEDTLKDTLNYWVSISA